jgi:D-lactate dehydrogenase (cytochrome)
MNTISDLHAAHRARPDARAVTDLVSALCVEYGDRAVTSRAVRDQHGHGEGLADSALPDVVVFPHTNEEVAGIVRLCHAARVPVIAFGVGTSLEGHVAALYGGVCMDLSQMNRVLEINVGDLDCRVQAGVTREQVNAELKGTGLFFPIDPGANATIGGMAATRASGTNAVRYGTMRENVLGLTVVLADGRVITTGGRARKSSSGYDLTRLFVGSEGTLGIITEVVLRLHPRPEAVSAAVCAFDSIERAVETVIATIQLGVPIARIELVDEAQMAAVNRYSKTTYTVAPTLFFEFHSDSAAHIDDQTKAVEALAAERGGHGFEWATRPEERERLWQARHDALYAALALRPGSKAWTTDVCVPISRLTECIMETRRDHESAPFPVTLVGHAGDGNFHLVYVLDPASRDELRDAERLNERMVMRALAMGGTCSGEHGVGLGKMKYLDAEHGPALDVMRAIKQALDPDNRLNPGKILPIQGT